MATDLLVWNITKDDIRVREAIVDESAWPAKSPTPPDDPDPKAIKDLKRKTRSKLYDSLQVVRKKAVRSRRRSTSRRK